MSLQDPITVNHVEMQQIDSEEVQQQDFYLILILMTQILLLQHKQLMDNLEIIQHLTPK
jgi:hypothetical protein